MKIKTRNRTSYALLGHLTLPFEVVRCRGQWQPRADGLGKLFPDEFALTRTGDYFIGGVWNYSGAWKRQQEAACAFAKFLRKVCACQGFLQHTGWPQNSEGIHRWEFVVAPKFVRGNTLAGNNQNMKTINDLPDQTIAEYSKEVGRLMDIIKTLQRIRYEPASVPDCEVGVDTFKIADDRLAGSKVREVRCRTAHGQAIMEAIQNLNHGSTLCVEQFAKKHKVSIKQMSNFICRAAKKGLLGKSGQKGFWKRIWPGNPHVPAPAPAAPAAPPGKPDFSLHRRNGNKASLELHLREACQERDRYREAGNDKLEEIAQRKVDDLEKRLEAANA